MAYELIVPVQRENEKRETDKFHYQVLQSGVCHTSESKQSCSQVDGSSNSTCFRQATMHFTDQRCFPGAGRSDEFYNHPASTDKGSRRSVNGDDFSGDWSLSPHISTRLPSASI